MATDDTNPTDLLVEFFTQPVEMTAKSEAAGRPIFEDREHIRIAFPADTRTEIVRLVEPADRQKYPAAYEAFKRENKRSESGTPIEEWPLLSKAKVKELKALGLDTVEHIANMGTVSREQLGPEARELTAQATAFLSTAKGSADAQKFAADNERLTDENKRLTEELKTSNVEVKRLTEELAKVKKAA